jgi:alpha-tubulin suppressor-like RCC1 family protein
VALDARVFCWGYNRWGQNGNGLTQTTNPAAPTTGDLRAVSVSAGGYHTCALTAAGNAFCWGSNQYGQLGIGSDTLFTVDPMAVRTTLRFKSIDAGATHTCAISVDDRVFCWGSAEYGELGDGASFKPGLPGPATPVQTLLLEPAGIVSAGVNETCAVQTAGGTFCWGRGTEGQLGNGNTNNFAVRQPIKPQGQFVFDVLAVGGSTHACGIDSGIIYCWGTGRFGQLGLGSETTSIVPQRIRR